MTHFGAPRGSSGTYSPEGAIPADPRIVAIHQRLTRLAAMTVILVGVAVLLGWAFNVASLKTVILGQVVMKANTAFAFVLAGLALGLRQAAATSSTARRLALGCAGVVALTGLLTLSEYVAGWDLGIDQLLVREAAGAVQTSSPGRMAPVTAASFVLVGAALGLLGARRRHFQWMREVLAFGVIAFALVSLLGYVYSIDKLLSFGPYTTIAAHTAAGFLVLGLGLLCAKPASGLIGIIASPTAGGLLARRLLPATTTVELALGWVLLAGHRADYYGAEFGIALMTSITVGILIGMIGLTARSIQRSDAARDRLLIRFDAVLRQLPVGVVIAEAPAGTLVLANDRATAITQRPLQYGETEIYHPEGGRQRVDMSPLYRALTAGEVVTEEEVVIERGDGALATLSFSATPIADRQGHTVAAVAIFADVTARKAAELEIQRLNADLELRVAELGEINKELDSFSYSVAHDLRAPLRGINGFSGILLEDFGPDLPPDAQRYLQNIRDGATKMGQLVDDLLAFSRLGRQPLAKSRVLPPVLVRQALAELEREREGRRVEIVLGELPSCEADPALLKQVYGNLLSNALKYTRARETARIEVGALDVVASDEEHTYFVKDNGVGFDMAFAPKLFGVFERLHRAEEYEGTGVGLAIVHRIIDRHGGRVWAEAAVDQGSTFWFTLPIVAPGSASPKMSRGTGQLGEKSET